MLLDTHIFLWWLFDDPRLPPSIRQNLLDPEQTVLVSVASVWEISTKYRIGKLPKAKSVAKNTPSWIIRAGFQSLSITPEHAQLAGSWDTRHRDPFDRMLAAQAKLEDVSLASTDRSLNEFPIQVVNG
jgi:PIN domain nuclease of toxin-antitoxin system